MNAAIKCLPYYVLEKTEECRRFFHKTSEGYFNFWNEILIMKTKSCNDTYLVLVNRGDRKYIGKIEGTPMGEMMIEYQKSIIYRQPKQMFIDFPELGLAVN